METRKVQLSGGTTYTVSLPKSWAEENGIEAGSTLAIHPNDDGSLLVEGTGDRRTDEREATVDVATDGPDAVERRVEAAYQIGVDALTLVDRTGHPDDRRRAVESVLRGLSGLEVLETTDTRLRLTNLVDAENVDVRKSTLRLRLVMLSMHRDAVTAVTEADPELGRRVVRRDDEADKLFAMITRHFRRALSDLQEVEKLDQSRDSLFEYYYTARQLERVADHAEKIAGFAVDDEARVPGCYADEVAAVGETARRIVDDAADVVLAGAGVETATDVLARRDRLAGEVEALDRDLYDHDDPAAACCVGVLLDSLARTADYGANVAEVALQQATRRAAAD